LKPFFKCCSKDCSKGYSKDCSKHCSKDYFQDFLGTVLRQEAEKKVTTECKLAISKLLRWIILNGS
jgi:hypothetical protein